MSTRCVAGFRTGVRTRALRFGASLLFILASAGIFAETPLSRSDARPATPAVAGISTSVVISQVYGGGGNAGSTWKNDFIELFNLGPSTVSLAGWSVQYASSSGSSWQVTALSGSIGPGQYYLVREAAGTGGTTNLPTPDVNGGISMSASTAKVALASSTTALTGTCPSTASIVDFVGYGSANCFEGTGSAPTLTSTTAALRNDNGCTDSGNNGTDFASGSPNPRNTSSPLNPCSGGGGPFFTTGSPLPHATVGADYTVTFGAAGGSGSGYTFLLLSGTLPPGLALDEDGVLEGEPTTTIGSPFSFTLQVTDSASAVASKTFQLAVLQADTCPVEGPTPRGCGVERWSVKTGSDPDAALVDLNSATPTTIASLRTFAYPSPNPPSNNRVAPAETTQWVIHGTLTKYKLEDDSDYHLVVQDGAGITMVTESVFPGDSPACVSNTSPFLPGMGVTRCAMDSSLPLATGSFQTVSVPVRIIGVGMFDFAHGQTGAAPNQIELHPILDIAFLNTANLTTATGSNVTVHAADLALTFPSVTASGTTTMAPLEPSASGTAPAGTILVGPAHNITTTATTSGSPTLCVGLTYLTDAAAFAKLKLLHAEGGSLVDRTSARSFDAKILCGILPSLTNVVVALATNPGTIAVNAGDNQNVAPNAAFQPLKAIVRDASSNPLAGVAVTFSAVAGGSGANGTFASSNPVLTDVNGIATASTLTANGIGGAFTVTASAAGLANLATFNATIGSVDAPTNVVATATSTTSVSIAWTAAAGATSYEVTRVAAGNVTASLGTTAATTFTDTLASPDTAYLYKVRTAAPSVSAYSAADLATTSVFTDPVLPGLVVQAVHFNQLRTSVNAVRALAALGAYSFTDPTLTSGTPIKAVHVTDLRAALDAARAALLQPAISYTRPTITPGTSMISAVDLYDLRDGVK
jgi:lamin tail-like protein